MHNSGKQQNTSGLRLRRVQTFVSRTRAATTKERKRHFRQASVPRAANQRECGQLRKLNNNPNDTRTRVGSGGGRHRYDEHTGGATGNETKHGKPGIRGHIPKLRQQGKHPKSGQAAKGGLKTARTSAERKSLYTVLQPGCGQLATGQVHTELAAMPDVKCSLKPH